MEHDELRAASRWSVPQRDDVRFLIDGVDARTYASQGQQRTAVLVLKLAELEFLRAGDGRIPGVAVGRRIVGIGRGPPGLFCWRRSRNNVQTFITTAHAEPLPTALMGRARVFQVHQGNRHARLNISRESRPRSAYRGKNGE